ncbi:MAG: hypothetical protein M3Y55_18610 [Pseudomonadota bacterium]|nr:hypothetical protein [Pseudomonadota bacterium]
MSRIASARQAGEGLTAGRELAHSARELVKRGSDPIDERDARREAAQLAEATKKEEQRCEQLTLCRAARS